MKIHSSRALSECEIAQSSRHRDVFDSSAPPAAENHSQHITFRVAVQRCLKSGRTKKKFSIALESQHRQWRNAIRARTYEVFTLITHFWIETSSLSLSFICANDQHNDDVDNISSGSRHKLDRNEQHAFGQPVELSKATSTTSKSESQHVFPSSSTSEIYSNKTYIYLYNIEARDISVGIALIQRYSLFVFNFLLGIAQAQAQLVVCDSLSARISHLLFSVQHENVSEIVCGLIIKDSLIFLL